jgi:hypothetical protein
MPTGPLSFGPVIRPITIWTHHGGDAGGGIGGIDSFTKLMLHMDGSDASTTFTDSSAGIKTVTANGNAQIDTGVVLTGFDQAGLFDGTGDYLSAANSADWDFGTDSDWTVDFWYRRSGAQAALAGLVSGTTNAGTGWAIMFGNSSGLGTTNAPTLITNPGSTFTVRATSSTALTDATWTHIAVMQSGTNAYIFQDGVVTAGPTSVSGVSFNSAGSGITVGRVLTDFNGFYMTGSMDELRISKGVARFNTAGFTPNAGPYTL